MKRKFVLMVFCILMLGVLLVSSGCGGSSSSSSNTTTAGISGSGE